MTWSDAADYGQAQLAERQLLSDDSMSMLSKANSLGQMRSLSEKPESNNGPTTMGDLIHGAMGGALGLGIAKGVGSVLGLKERTQGRLEDFAMAAGGLWNAGYFKKKASVMEQDAHNAFRLGFVKAALDSGLLKTGGFAPVVIPLSPESMMAPIRGLGGLATGAGSLTGSVAGTLDSPDEDDEDLARLQVEKEMLRDQLGRILADRRSRSVKQLLAKRRGM